MKNRKKHIIEVMLEYMNIPYSTLRLNSMIQENPLAYTFWGIKDVLLNFNVTMRGYKPQLEELINISGPFITLLDGRSNEFFLVTTINNDSFSYLTITGEKITKDLDFFLQHWNGIVLVPTMQKERNRNKFRNKIENILIDVRIPFIIACITLLTIWLFFENNTQINVVKMIIASIYAIGMVVCILLIQQSLGKYNSLSKRICFLNRKTNCQAVLESNGAKLFNIISWGDIGFVYFTGSFFIFMLIPSALSFLFWLTVLSLPYSIWSVYYQGIVVKRWCPLCLCVQCLFWILFVSFLEEGAHLQPLHYTFSLFIEIFFCYAMPMVCLWFVIPLFRKLQRNNSCQYKFNRMKSNEVIFDIIKKKQPQLKVEDNARKLVLGNVQADMKLTIVSNPYCGFCAEIHFQLMDLFKKYRNEMKIEFLLIGDPDSKETIKWLIGVYYQYGSELFEQIYSEWYEKKQRIFNQYPVDFKNEAIEETYAAIESWKKQASLEGVPTVYVNDYELPEEYQIKDLRYFL